MERNAALYDLFMEAAGAVYTATSQLQARNPPPAPPLLLQLRAGLAESPGWFLAQAAEFDPEPLTVELLRVRDIYASERIVAALLELMAGERWIERNSSGAYHLTAFGRTILQQRRTMRAELLEAITPLPAKQLDRLARLMQRLIAASLQSPEPPGVWCLVHSRRRAPMPAAPPLVQLMHYFDDINAFRDDAHMAAWQPFELAGYAWEAFTLICTGEASTSAQVSIQLAHRGYSPTDYNAALEQLVQREWLSLGSAQTYRITAAGRAAHAHAEQLTNGYFYQPWEALTDEEIEEMYTLLCQLRDSPLEAQLPSSHA